MLLIANVKFFLKFDNQNCRDARTRVSLIYLVRVIKSWFTLVLERAYQLPMLCCLFFRF